MNASTHSGLRSFLFATVVVLSLLSNGAAQMVIDDYDPLRHNRFVIDRFESEFIGDELDISLSGVGRVNEGAGRWVTMIAPTHFLSASHAKADAGTVTFFTGNSLDGPTVECSIAPDTGRQIGETDIWVGTLAPSAACDTSALTFYDIASPGDYTGSEVVAAGQSNLTLGARTTNMRVGRNVVSYAESGSFFRGTGDHLILVDDSADGDVRNMPLRVGPDHVDSEFRVANGDSGGPAFVRSVTGDYELIGIHSYLGYDGEQQAEAFSADRWASIDTYLPTQRNNIYEQVQLDDPSFTFVRNLDDEPVGDAPGGDVFALRSGFDCSLDGRIDAQDLNCTTWVGSLSDLSALLNEFKVPLGDIDLDGKVGFYEFLKLTSRFSEAGQYTDGDFTLDGYIDFSDFLILTRNFGVETTVNPSAAPLPEPNGTYGLSWLLLVLLAIRHLRTISR